MINCLIFLFFFIVAAKLQKNTFLMKFFRKKFARFKKSPYLCTRKQQNLLQ